MNHTLKILSLPVIACIAAILAAAGLKETPPPDFVASTIPILESAKTHAFEVAEAMPEDKYSYKPTEVSKTFGEQIVHIGYTLSFFTKAMLKGEQIEYAEPDVSNMSKAEVIAILEQGFEDIMAAVNEMSDEDLKVEIPFFGDKTITKQQVILFAQDHCTNHRAKANLYIRMNDIEPPGYKFL